MDIDRLFNRESALEEYDRDVNELWDMIRNSPEEIELATAIMDLRKLDPMTHYSIGTVLYSGTPEAHSLRNFEVLMDPDRHHDIPSMLSEVISDIWWMIEDDGYMSLVRMEVESDIASAAAKKGIDLKVPACTRVIYFLNIDMWVSDKDQATRWLDEHRYNFVHPVTKKSVTGHAFSQLGEFTKLIQVLGDESIWADGLHSHINLSKALDKLFFKNMTK